MNAMYAPGAITAQNATITRGDLAALQPHLVRAADDRGARFAPDRREAHQRRRVGDDEDDRGGDGERQRAIDRVGGVAREVSRQRAQRAFPPGGSGGMGCSRSQSGHAIVSSARCGIAVGMRPVNSQRRV